LRERFLFDRRVFAVSFGFWLVSSFRPVAAETRPLLIFAAASLKDVLDTIGVVFLAETGTSLTVSVAGSGQLARQIEAGAPADVTILADDIWMDWLETRNLIRPETRRNIISNQLVLIAPADRKPQPEPVDLAKILLSLGSERLAVADPETVPAGRYAKEALIELKLWESVSSRLAATENVRAALQLVARGETPLGIVYASDAQREPNVRVLGVFPEESHSPIVYPAAVLTGSDHPQAIRFLDFLASDRVQALFVEAGFRRLKARS
jgi:molybdate transport system substrate-binding protein